MKTGTYSTLGYFGMWIMRIWTSASVLILSYNAFLKEVTFPTFEPAEACMEMRK
jgi:hypothetical protein